MYVCIQESVYTHMYIKQICMLQHLMRTFKEQGGLFDRIQKVKKKLKSILVCYYNFK